MWSCRFADIILAPSNESIVRNPPIQAEILCRVESAAGALRKVSGSEPASCKLQLVSVLDQLALHRSGASGDPIAFWHSLSWILALQIEGDRKDAFQKEITHMKRTIAIAFFASTMIMALSSASAQGKGKATIPFDFRVGSAALPAGSYVIEYTASKVVWFHSQDGRKHVLALAASSSGDIEPPERLVFNRYGDRYFLSETRTSSGESEMTFAPSKLERNIRTEEASLKNAGQSLIALK
jgi:hypothetical protein